MNKHRRHEIKMLKLQKRLKNYRLTDKAGNFYAFRSTGKPCSCWVCQQPEDNYSRPKFRKRTAEELKACHVDGYTYLA